MSIDKLPWLYDSESVRGWRLIKAAVFVLMGMGMLVWMLFHPVKSGKEIKERGTAIEGRVYRIDERKDGKETISYAFTVDTTLYSIEARRVADTEGLTRLGPVEIWYDPANPKDCITLNELRAQEGRPGSIWGFVVIGVMVFLALLQIIALFIPRRTMLSD